MILAFYVNSGWNGRFLRSFWSKEQKYRKLAGTSQRPNVATSGQREWKSTSGTRRDVETSRRQCDFCLTIIKRKRDQKSRGSKKRMDEGTESRATAKEIIGEDTFFCIFFFPEILLMFYRLILCIAKSSMF